MKTCTVCGMPSELTHGEASFVEQQEDAENEAEQKVADAAIDGDA